MFGSKRHGQERMGTHHKFILAVVIVLILIVLLHRSGGTKQGNGGRWNSGQVTNPESMSTRASCNVTT